MYPASPILALKNMCKPSCSTQRRSLAVTASWSADSRIPEVGAHTPDSCRIMGVISVCSVGRRVFARSHRLLPGVSAVWTEASFGPDSRLIWLSLIPTPYAPPQLTRTPAATPWACMMSLSTAHRCWLMDNTLAPHRARRCATPSVASTNAMIPFRRLGRITR